MSEIQFCPKCSTKLIEKNIEEKQRLSCSSEKCDYIFWDSPVPVVAALVENNKKIILARNKTWPENMFGLITGFLEKDESPEKGVLREVREELGLSGEITELIGVYKFSMMNQLIVAYHVLTEGVIKMGEELVEIKPVAPERLKPWNFGTGLAVRDWMMSHGFIKA